LYNSTTIGAPPLRFVMSGAVTRFTANWSATVSKLLNQHGPCLGSYDRI
jgi:hypothetical protein